MGQLAGALEDCRECLRLMLGVPNDGLDAVEVERAVNTELAAVVAKVQARAREIVAKSQQVHDEYVRWLLRACLRHLRL